MTLKVRNFESATNEPAGTVLIIGAFSDRALLRATSNEYSNFHQVLFDALTKDLLAALDPILIVSSLFDRTFDATEVAVLLQDHGYQGRYVAVVPDLPHPALIRKEVRNAAPLIDFEILVTSRNETVWH